MCFIYITKGGVLMIKGALALALMSTVGMGGMVTVSSDGNVTTSYFMPSVMVVNDGPRHPHYHAPKPVIHHTVLHKPHKPVVKKEHKPKPPKAQKPTKHKQQGKTEKAPAHKGKSKGGKK